MKEKGRRVLLVDLDPQGCLTFSLGQDPDKLSVSIHDVLLGEVEPDAALVDTSEGIRFAMVAASIAVCGFEHGVRQISALGLTGHRHPCLPT